MKSKMESQTDELVAVIGELAVARQQLARQAEQQYSFEVYSILRDQCREPRRIERLLDGMLDFCFDDEMLRLYKKLCRYYFKMDPKATVSYVNAYCEMWGKLSNPDFKPLEFERYENASASNTRALGDGK